MTRGKHAVSAAARRAITEREGQVETYQRKVRELTAERNHLRESLEAQRQSHALEVRRLKAERDEGIGPALAVAQREARSQRERADHAERERRRMLETHDLVMRRLLTMLKQHAGMGHFDAVEWLLAVIGGGRRFTIYEGQEHFVASAEQIQVLQQLRGLRAVKTAGRPGSVARVREDRPPR